MLKEKQISVIKNIQEESFTEEVSFLNNKIFIFNKKDKIKFFIPFLSTRLVKEKFNYIYENDKSHSKKELDKIFKIDEKEFLEGLCLFFMGCIGMLSLLGMIYGLFKGVKTSYSEIFYISILFSLIILFFFEIVDLFTSKFKVFMNLINLKYIIKNKMIQEKTLSKIHFNMLKNNIDHDILEHFLINKKFNIKYKDLNNLSEMISSSKQKDKELKKARKILSS